MFFLETEALDGHVTKDHHKVVHFFLVELILDIASPEYINIQLTQSKVE